MHVVVFRAVSFSFFLEMMDCFFETTSPSSNHRRLFFLVAPCLIGRQPRRFDLIRVAFWFRPPPKPILYPPSRLLRSINPSVNPSISHPTNPPRTSLSFSPCFPPTQPFSFYPSFILLHRPSWTRVIPSTQPPSSNCHRNDALTKTNFNFPITASRSLQLLLPTCYR